MKKFILALTLVFSSLAMAQDASADLVVFEVKSAQFSPDHVTNFKKASVQIDYAQELVTLTVYRSFKCPPNRMCPLMLPLPVVIELPITSVQTNECGVRQVTAEKDMRPADGELKTLTIEDGSDITCPTLLPFEGKAQYETRYESMLTGGSAVIQTSTMVLKQSETQAE